MKAKDFTIKVGDLLQEGGKSDLIEFNGKFCEGIENVSNKGISAEIEFKSLNQDSLLVALKNIKCEIVEDCDRCSEKYTRVLGVKEYLARFVANKQIKEEEENLGDIEIFVINAKDETIDIEPMLVQAIKLEEPFTKLCPKCNQEIEESEDKEDEDLLPKGNVFFH